MITRRTFITDFHGAILYSGSALFHRANSMIVISLKIGDIKMIEAARSKWYDKKALVIILCIVFFPAGLYSLWKNTTFSKASKIVISVLVALMVVYFASQDATEVQQAEPLSKNTASIQTKKSIIQASLKEFEAKIPLLTQIEKKITKRNDGMEYSYKGLTTMGQSNSVTFYDDKMDGNLDQILMILCVNANNDNARIESFGLGYRFVEIAGGNKEKFMDEYMKWIAAAIKNHNGESQGKWFGTVLAGASYTPADDGGVLLLSIGKDNATGQ